MRMYVLLDVDMSASLRKMRGFYSRREGFVRIYVLLDAWRPALGGPKSQKRAIRRRHLETGKTGQGEIAYSGGCVSQKDDANSGAACVVPPGEIVVSLAFSVTAARLVSRNLLCDMSSGAPDANNTTGPR